RFCTEATSRCQAAARVLNSLLAPPSISKERRVRPSHRTSFFHVSATGSDRIGAHDFCAAIVSRAPGASYRRTT
ncbi:hypothetical protein ALC56_12490, partial [Trachymyrmex septentrionalis]